MDFLVSCFYYKHIYQIAQFVTPAAKEQLGYYEFIFLTSSS